MAELWAGLPASSSGHALHATSIPLRLLVTHRTHKADEECMRIGSGRLEGVVRGGEPPARDDYENGRRAAAKYPNPVRTRPTGLYFLRFRFDYLLSGTRKRGSARARTPAPCYRDRVMRKHIQTGNSNGFAKAGSSWTLPTMEGITACPIFSSRLPVVYLSSGDHAPR